MKKYIKPSVNVLSLEVANEIFLEMSLTKEQGGSQLTREEAGGWNSDAWTSGDGE